MGLRDKMQESANKSKEARAERAASKMDAKHLRLIEEARPALHDGEQVEDICTGLMNTSRFGSTQKRKGSLVVTDRRLVFFSKKIGGHESHEFAYHMILSLQTKTGAVFGSIHLHAAGDQIEIQQVDKGEVERVTEAIRSHMNVTGGGVAPTIAPVDVADQLTKLAALREQGILTEEEFAAQKAKLLG